jgi:hypothetical protein
MIQSIFMVAAAVGTLANGKTRMEWEQSAWFELLNGDWKVIRMAKPAARSMNFHGVVY